MFLMVTLRVTDLRTLLYTYALGPRPNLPQCFEELDCCEREKEGGPAINKTCAVFTIVVENVGQ